MSDTSVRTLTAATAIIQTTRTLAAAGVETPARDARLLVGAALGMGSGQLLGKPEAELDAGTEDRLADFVARRVAREPVSRILGTRGFYGRDFRISPATLDPRPDSETLIDAALELVGYGGNGRTAPLRILDVGTGSGCLLITLLAELPNATGLGTDIDPAALVMARRNASYHGVASRADWKVARSLNGVPRPVDLLIANPPYVRTADVDALEPEVRDHEPRAALDGGEDGLQVYREIAGGLAQMVPDGWAVFEVGKDQASAVADVLMSGTESQAAHVRTFKDLNGVDRCVAWMARS